MNKKLEKLSEKTGISTETLECIEKSMTNLKKDIVSGPIDLSEFEIPNELTVETIGELLGNWITEDSRSSS